MSSISQAIKERIENTQDITISAHIRPDGDAVGAVIGLGLVLLAMGKDVNFAFSETLPKRFRIMKKENGVQKRKIKDSDIIIALDCADLKRLSNGFHDRKIDINIDHHATNEKFAELNFVDQEAASTTEVLAILLEEWGFKIPPQAANALLMGIVTDTIGFRTPNTSPRTLRIAADLIEKGGKLSETYQQTLSDISWEASLLWAFGLNNMQKEGEILYTVLTCEDRRKSGYTGRDDADLTNFLNSIQEHQVSILFNEQSESSVKISWRSRSDINVAAIAMQFGGGGHHAAAGAEINLPLLEIQKKVIETTRNYIIMSKN